ncbi:transcriptional regulator [Histidinibacterium aquaticum]|uniref:Transcriptional regulator n=1 Tax=Histidinibacterium aquaticum TaxID=2613962 RepID=A0A5J5GQ73_9RHOB|nr:transcriptional regulator [Histidinibacterium aquaticum]
MPDDRPHHACKLLTADQVRHLFGGVSDMSLWRWTQDSTLGFPQAIYIQRRRYWREADVLSFIERRAMASAAEGERQAGGAP